MSENVKINIIIILIQIVVTEKQQKYAKQKTVSYLFEL